MKFTCLSEAGGFNFPPCQLLNLCGFRILFDCPVDLSALTIFSPIPTNSYGGKLDEHTSDCPSHTSLNLVFVDQKRRKIEKPLDANNLIHAKPSYKIIEKLHLWNVSLIDVVLISSPMGLLGLPFLTRTKGFSAKIYATEATARLGQLMMEDLVAMQKEFRQFYGPEESVFPQWMKWEELEALPPKLKEIALGKDGAELGSWMPLYSAADVRDCLQKVHGLRYAEEACYNGTLIIEAFSSGLEIGSCNWTLRGPKRNIAYLSSSIFESRIAMDFDFHALQGSDIILYSDFSSWNGVDTIGANNTCSSSAMSNFSTMSDRPDNWETNAGSLLNTDERSEEMEKLNFVCSCSVDSVKTGGSVLITIGRLGIVLQLLEQLSFYLESSTLKVPKFIISSVAEELLAFTNIIPEWLCKHRQEKNDVAGAMHSTLSSLELATWTCCSFAATLVWGSKLSAVMEEGVDADLALLPFKPMAMKVLQCSFLSGIKLQKVPPLLKILQPKLVLLPDYTREYMGSLSNSLPIIFYSENETLRVPKLKDCSELYIATDLASQISWTKLKQEDMNISRLKGELFVEKGKHCLLPGNEQLVSSQTKSLLHWGTLKLESLVTALRKLGIDGYVEQAMSYNGSENVSSLRIFEPSKALIEVKEKATVISTADENLATLISEAIRIILNGI